jgi:hypothetical protein
LAGRLAGSKPRDKGRLGAVEQFCEAEIVDGLIELPLEVTHRIPVRAERRVVEELLEEYRQVRGKTGIFFRVAEAAVGNPDGVVREVIFPVAGELTFEAWSGSIERPVPRRTVVSTPRFAHSTAPITGACCRSSSLHSMERSDFVVGRKADRRVAAMH